VNPETEKTAETENHADEQTVGNGQETLETEAAGPSEPEALRNEAQEQRNKYMYLYAEFENYKKRVIRERSDLIKFGHESLARDLLQVSDNLERALAHSSGGDALVTGIKMVHSQLVDTLSRFGVTSVSALGQKFDPQLHEAVGSEKTDDASKDGTVVQEHQKGYTLHGRLLRPARVVIATK